MDLNVTITDQDITLWIGDLVILNKKQAKIISVMDQKILELEQQINELQSRLMPIEKTS